MPIATRCPKCKAKLKGPDNLVGHTLKCPGCGTPVAITAEFLVPPATPRQAAAGVKPQPAPAGSKSVPPTPKNEPPRKTTNPSKASIYDDLEIIYDDLEIIAEETAQTPPMQTEEAPRLPPPESAKPKPAPKPPEKKPAAVPAKPGSIPNLNLKADEKPPAPPPKVQARPQAKEAPPKEPEPEKQPAKSATPQDPAPPTLKIDAGDDFNLLPVLERASEETPPAAKHAAPPKASQPPGMIPNLDLDNVDLAPLEKKAAPPLLPNMDLDKADHAPPRKQEKPLLPNTELNNANSPLMDDFDDIKLHGEDDEEIPLTEVTDEEEVFDEFEVIEEGKEDEVAEAQEQMQVELRQIMSTEEEDVPEVTLVEDEEDEVAEVVAAEDDDVDDLEEVDEPAGDSAFSFKLLQPSVIFVQGQSGMFSINNAYDLLNGRTKKHLGEALEKKDDAAVVMRLFVGNNLVPTRVEVLEGRHRDLVLTIKRPPHLWTSKAEIYDADNELLGSFQIQPFSMLMSKPIWISDHNEKKFAQMQAQWMKGKCVYSTPDGKKLAETMSQAVYEQRIVLKWAPRGGSFYITFTKLAEKKPRHKLLLLGTVIGIDLFYTQNRQGPIIGGGRRF
jgi:hypothetical protein